LRSYERIFLFKAFKNHIQVIADKTMMLPIVSLYKNLSADYRIISVIISPNIALITIAT